VETSEHNSNPHEAVALVTYEVAGRKGIWEGNQDILIDVVPGGIRVRNVAKIKRLEAAERKLQTPGV
jgi:hypothetical protein